MIEAPPLASVTTEPGVTAGNGSPMIRVCSLKKQIDGQEILRGVDLEVRTGETLVLIGRSGGGRSGLPKNINRVRGPDTRENWNPRRKIICRNPRQTGDIRAKGGSLFQSAARFQRRTMTGNIH